MAMFCFICMFFHLSLILLSTSYSQTFINVWFSNLKPHNFWVSRQHCLCHPLRRLIMALHNTTHFFLKPKLKMIAIRFFAEAKYSQVFPFVLPLVPEKMSFLVDFKYASVIFLKRYQKADGLIKSNTNTNQTIALF